ncbi:MAG TPA: hypothetical protein VLU25_08190 [Acidobacteriota bacterium]|nr:hypothetical protein [Acidobacteriota bacterium]
MRNILAVLFFCLLSGLVLAQTQEGLRRVEVVALEDDDVNRIARALSTTPQRIRQARSLLEEALTVLLQEEPIENLHGLPELWVRVHPRAAVDRIGEIADRLVRQAGRAQAVAEYDHSWGLLLGCAAQMAQQDATRAHQLLLDWPAPPQRLGIESLKKHSEMWRRLTSQGFARQFRRDPRQAINSLARSGGVPMSVLKQLEDLRESPDKAPVVVEAVIERLSARQADQRSAQVLLNLAHRVSRSYPELLPPLFDALRRMTPPSANGFVMKAGPHELTMSYAEFQIWNVLRHNTSRRPQLMLELAQEMPWLSDLVDKAGGLDEFLNAAQVGSLDGQGNIRRFESRTQAREINDRTQDLVREMPFRPDWVRRQVEQMSEQEDGFKQLKILFEQSRHRNLDLAVWTLESIRRSIELQDLEPQEEERRLATLISWEGSLNDVVDFDLIQMGLALADEVRGGEGGGSQPVRLSNSPYIERASVAAWARLDFQAARDYTRTFAPHLRLILLQAMIQHLASR